jgi:hypothetical protein
MKPSATHPTNDPNLPSFVHPIAADHSPDLDLVLKVWRDVAGHKAEFIPKEFKENPKAYAGRLNRVAFDNRFAPAIRAHAGLLSDFAISEQAPTSMVEAAQNIDLCGNSWHTFSDGVDQHALRDGGAIVLVDYQTEDPEIDTLYKQAKSQRRPYLVEVDRRNILNWSIVDNNGRPTLDRVVIRESHLMPDGTFGVAEKTLYRLLTPGYWQVWEIIDNKGKYAPLLVDEGETSLGEIPIVWYSFDNAGLFASDLPFAALARLNIEHLQKRSDLNEVLHKCNLPVPVRKGAPVNPATQKMPDLTIGPNSVVDVPENGDFKFAEPAGTAIASSMQDLGNLEAAMDRVALAFLSGGEVQRTATEVVLDSAQIQSAIRSLSRRKESLWSEVARLWAAYTGETYDNSLRPIEVNERILKAPAQPQEIQVILDAIGVTIDHETGLNMLVDRQWLPATADIAAIMQRTGAAPNDEPTI